ncbi:transporter [Sphingomonas sp. Leaf24]|uniref:TolC family protein n=1 Tax=unclassified Sphingomonas TaxID=196159 RepID=UPI0006F80C0C|nr:MULTISPECIES: TolC family protein [unclassified Sphingomonas]KQM20469.1 transporter [Sphingomonas sp. Leaf5]KQM92310.1 transporter [Sphingomonas sp. Leaf24]
MQIWFAAIVVVASCAGPAMAQTAPADAGLVYTLDRAVAAAGGRAPSIDVATAAIDAAEQARAVAALRPNPQVQAQVENIVGSGAYQGLRSAETTLGIAIPIELGGKRSARGAVAGAQVSRTRIEAAVIAADLRLRITQMYVGALAADRRVATAREQARIATEALRVATIRVEAGRASPLERQRAEVARINAEAGVERVERLAAAARTNLARRTGQPVTGPLDDRLLDRLPADAQGPVASVLPDGTLALAAARADIAVADAGIRLARAARVPDLNIGPAIRRLEATNDTAAVVALSLPIPLFDRGRAAIAQASAERSRAEAQARVTALDVAQAITDAQVQAANAATTARTAAGPALAAAQEAARIARIGYREGKFGQTELLDVERTLAETRLAAIDALAEYQNARAQLERLTAPAPLAEKP